MRYSLFTLFYVVVLVVSVHAQQPICPGLPVRGGACSLYVKGFDITGVTTEVDLTYPQIKNVCDCISACINSKNKCANYVWKFSTKQSALSGHRTCTLYSNFNLPPDVTIAYDVGNSVNIQLLSANNNPQGGGPVPQAFMDKNLDTIPDNDAISGPLWFLADGTLLC